MSAKLVHMTDTDTTAREVLAAAVRFTAAVDGYRAYRLDLSAVREARADVATAHRAMLAPGDVADCDAYLDARRANDTTRRVTRRLLGCAVAGHPDR